MVSRRTLPSLLAMQKPSANDLILLMDIKMRTPFFPWEHAGLCSLPSSDKLNLCLRARLLRFRRSKCLHYSRVPYICHLDIASIVRMHTITQI
jgi:hypothetical protein